MSKTIHAVNLKHEADRGSLRTYVAGFATSVVLTLAAYFCVQYLQSDSWIIGATIAVLALIQLYVQLKFFLHFGAETKPRWKSIIFYFTLMVVLILVFGSIWIMNNLNYHTAIPSDSSIIHEEGIIK